MNKHQTKWSRMLCIIIANDFDFKGAPTFCLIDGFAYVGGEFRYSKCNDWSEDGFDYLVGEQEVIENKAGGMTLVSDSEINDVTPSPGNGIKQPDKWRGRMRSALETKLNGGFIGNQMFNRLLDLNLVEDDKPINVNSVTARGYLFLVSSGIQV